MVILKDTALGYIISYSELIRGGQTLATNYGNLIPTLIVIAAMFILINLALSGLAKYIEARLRRSRGGGKTGTDLTARPGDDPDGSALATERITAGTAVGRNA